MSWAIGTMVMASVTFRAWVATVKNRQKLHRGFLVVELNLSDFRKHCEDGFEDLSTSP